MAKERITLVEVGARDGLQNELQTIPTELKIRLIDALAESGLPVIEATSFVSPKWVPQMADHADVMRGITRKENVRYPVLVPNERGFIDAIAAGATEIAVFTAASEAFSQKNTNCSIDESFDRIRAVLNLAKQKSIPVRGYLSCVLGCPYEGEVSLKQVVKVAKKLIDLGCYQVSLGDTIGIGTPNKARALVQAVKQSVAIEQIAVHFHDTYAQALVNIYSAIEEGVRTVDSAVSGLGGCPYAPGAGGNVATEDVVYMLSGMGIETGVDLPVLVKAGQLICDYLGHAPRSKAALAIARANY
jgi:hydroxymethylglutaryl-CoA lyase